MCPRICNCGCLYNDYKPLTLYIRSTAIRCVLPTYETSQARLEKQDTMINKVLISTDI